MHLLKVIEVCSQGVVLVEVGGELLRLFLVLGHGLPQSFDRVLSSRRFLLRCELDAAFFHLYGIERDDVDYIMETFPIVKRKDEAKYGEYRTKRVILEMYGAMQQAMETGAPYRSIVSPHEPALRSAAGGAVP